MSTLNLNKDLASTWQVDGDEVRINIPFAKVNEERRTVSGFATLDNVDQHGDVVEYEASVRAFKAFRGNVREMHMPVAVGKVVDFQPREFTDEETGQTYKGIFVTAYISKGAQDTWEKVKDGTLSGFSIAGAIKNKEVKRIGEKYINLIKEYLLGELSLVDSPANQFANVLSMAKSGDTNIISGMAADVKILNVLIDDSDNVIVTKDDAREGFTNIGWVEDVGDTSDEVKDIVKSYKAQSLEEPPQDDVGDSEDLGLEKDVEGGATVANDTKDEAVDETVEKSNEVDESQGVVTSDDVTSEVEDEGEVEKAADVDETEGLDTPDIDVDAIVEKVLAKVQAQLADATEDADKGAEDDSVKKSLDALTEQISGLAEKVGSVESRVNEIEDSGAVKKSLDVEGNDDESEGEEGESFWRGGFLGASNLA